MKIASTASIVIIVVGIAIVLLQLWFSVFSAEFFVKVLITLGLLLVGFVLTALIRREYTTDSDLKKDKFLD